MPARDSFIMEVTERAAMVGAPSHVGPLLAVKSVNLRVFRQGLGWIVKKRIDVETVIDRVVLC